MDLLELTHTQKHVWRTLDLARELTKLHTDVDVEDYITNAIECEETITKVAAAIEERNEQMERHSKQLFVALETSKKCNDILKKTLLEISKKEKENSKTIAISVHIDNI